MKTYNKENVFAKIIRGEADSITIYEDKFMLCFENKFKEASLHWLIVPKGEYTCFDDFMAKASAEMVVHFFSKIKDIAQDHGLDKEGYKLVTNNGEGAGQSVPHFHVHLLSGKDLRHV